MMHSHIPAHPGWYVHTFAVHSAKGTDPTHAADMQQTLNVIGWSVDTLDNEVTPLTPFGPAKPGVITLPNNMLRVRILWHSGSFYSSKGVRIGDDAHAVLKFFKEETK